MNIQQTDGCASESVASEPIVADTNGFEGFVIINASSVLTARVCQIASCWSFSAISWEGNGQTNFRSTLKPVPNEARITLANVFTIRSGRISR